MADLGLCLGTLTEAVTTVTQRRGWKMEGQTDNKTGYREFTVSHMLTSIFQNLSRLHPMLYRMDRNPGWQL